MDSGLKKRQRLFCSLPWFKKKNEMYQVRAGEKLKLIKILAIHLFTSELPKSIKVSIFTKDLQ